jgi:hypothetical protein
MSGRSPPFATTHLESWLSTLTSSCSSAMYMPLKLLILIRAIRSLIRCAFAFPSNQILAAATFRLHFCSTRSSTLYSSNFGSNGFGSCGASNEAQSNEHWFGTLSTEAPVFERKRKALKARQSRDGFRVTFLPAWRCWRDDAFGE